MPEPAEDVQADAAVADESVEQPSPPAAPEKPKRARRRIDWRAFLRENARLLITFALLAAGVVFVILGWYGAAHTNILTEQIPYLISGGLRRSARTKSSVARSRRPSPRLARARRIAACARTRSR